MTWGIEPAFNGQVYLEGDQASHKEPSGGQQQPNSAAWGEVARLLSRKHDRIDPLQALSLLPEQVLPLCCCGCSLACVQFAD